MKRIISAGILLLLGVAVLFYPAISSYLSEKNSSHALDSHNQTMAALDPEVAKAEREKAVIYNESLAGNPLRDPFVYGSGRAQQSNYYELLNINGDNIMGRIEIPKINVDLPFYHSTRESVLKRGVGHLEGSSMPVGGPNTHSVLTGHTGLTSAKLFTDLTELENGDLFFLTVLGETLAYEVDHIQVVEPEETSSLRLKAGGEFCTLLTCTPYGVNSHRLLVRGARTKYIPEQKNTIQSIAYSHADRLVIMAAEAAVVAMLILITVTLDIRRLRENRALRRQLEKVG